MRRVRFDSAPSHFPRAMRGEKIEKEKINMAENFVKGTVKWFSARRGYGFVADGAGKEFFVHFSEIQMEGFRKLLPDEAVKFQTEMDEQGRGIARNVFPLTDDADSDALYEESEESEPAEEIEESEEDLGELLEEPLD